MNKKTVFFVCMCLLKVCSSIDVQVSLEDRGYKGIQSVNVVEPVEESNQGLHTTLYKIVNTFSCSVSETVEGSQLIVYGTKGWTFPEQDVNITLKYPNNDRNKKYNIYTITNFTVALHVDGHSSNGYITKGGILQDRIELLFTSSNISSLRYEFWLYGVLKNSAEIDDISKLNTTC